jgi:hypothetical protein
MYGEQFGHVRVPTAFVVPDADGWPAEARAVTSSLLCSRCYKHFSPPLSLKLASTSNGYRW